MMTDDPRWADPSIIAAAAVLRRLRDARVGADRQNRGKYAVYFFGDDGREIRSVGGFESVHAAAVAVDLIIAETVIDDAAVYGEDSAS